MADFALAPRRLCSSTTAPKLSQSPAGMRRVPTKAMTLERARETRTSAVDDVQRDVEEVAADGCGPTLSGEE